MLQGQGRPEVRRCANKKSGEPGRRDTDDVECGTIEHKRFSDDGGIGCELALPEGVIEHHDGMRAGELIVVR